MPKFLSLYEAERDRRRYCQKVQNVVAEISHEHGGTLFHVDHFAHWMRTAADGVELFAVFDNFVRTPVRDGDQIRVLEALQQVERHLQLST